MSRDTFPSRSMPDGSLPDEALVEVIASNGLKTVLICTPDNLTDLVTGWLFTQRIITSVDQIRTVQVCDANVRVLVQIDHGVPVTESTGLLTSSGCSGGYVRADLFSSSLTAVQSTLTVSGSSLLTAIDTMYRRARVERNISGMHCAALISEGVETAAVRCDIGRHNAVDKVIGAALAQRRPFDRSVLVTSGRISSDMMLKAAVAGIPVLATERSVTSLAADYAERLMISVAGRIRRPQPIIIDCANRIGGLR